MVAQTLEHRIDAMTVEGELYTREESADNADKKVRCYACGHRCLIREGGRGICKVRFNEGGVLRVPYGYVGALQVDPIEKKPFNHFSPGETVLSFGMLGCNLHCPYCQNHDISQYGRDKDSLRDPLEITPQGLVQMAQARGATAIASTYNEPLITSEWAVAVFKEARKAGLRTLYISSGNTTPEVVAYLRPHLDGYKIDLKSMRDKNYRQLGAVLQNVLDSIQMVYDAGLWTEIVTLVIPGFNDSNEELWDAARFIASVSPDIPWHITAFHPDYKMMETPRTTVESLTRAAEIGVEAGLRYVYAGNLPGKVGEWEHTYCPNCHETLVRRVGYHVVENRLKATYGLCPRCKTNVPGVWD